MKKMKKIIGGPIDETYEVKSFTTDYDLHEEVYTILNNFLVKTKITEFVSTEGHNYCRVFSGSGSEIREFSEIAKTPSQLISQIDILDLSKRFDDILNFEK